MPDTAPLDVPPWRKEERKRLISERMALLAAEREGLDEAIRDRLATLIGPAEGLVISAYWPFRAEPDLRPLLRHLRDGGARIALPVVVAKGQPLIFREWLPGTTLARGVWNIPYPEDGPEVVPDVSIAPVVGFDGGCFRLGYGGGFFDRTLAALAVQPRGIGVGYAFQRIATIHPQPHDIPMAAVVTEQGVTDPG
jgi:5,10-methenyltetrahydrofolate synthetase